jgi:hypothetical protein
MSSRVDPLHWQSSQVTDPKTGRPTGEFIRQWQNLIAMVEDIAAAQAAADAAQANADALETPSYVTLGTNPTLQNERVLTASSNVTVADAGAGSTVTVDLSATGVTAVTYGSATQVPQIAVDAKGRITSAVNVSAAIYAPLVNGDVGPVAIANPDNEFIMVRIA